MNLMNLMERVQGVFRDVFNDASIEITEETTALDIEEWDSLTHVQLIIALENEFNLKFAIKEIIELNNVGDIISLLETKL